MYRLNTEIRLTMLCLSGSELYSRWVPLSSSTHCVANKRQSLIDKGFAKSRWQIYELIGLRHKICQIQRIASL